MRRSLLLTLAVALLAPALHAQSLLDAGRDALTGEPLVLSAPPESATETPPALGGDLALAQHLGAGTTKLVRSVGTLTVYEDGIDLVAGFVGIEAGTGAPVFAEVGRYRLPALPSDAVAVGTRLYVALRKNQGVLILDVTPGTGFTVVGQVTGPDALAVAVSGTTVYVGRGSAGVTAYDVSLPSLPVQLGTVDTPGSANGLALSGTLLAVADGNVSAGPDVRLYDVSTAGAFAPLGTAEASGFATYAAFYAGRLYVTGGAGLLAFDVTDPAAPTLAGSTPAGGETTYEVVFDAATDRAYVAGLAGLRVVDVSAPAPVEIGAYDPGGQGLSVAYNAFGFGLLADRFNGLRFVSVADPAAPALRRTLRNGGFAHKGVFAGDRLYVTNLGGSLRVFDTSGGTVVETAALDLPPNTQEVLVLGDRAYVTDADGEASGLSVVDVSDAAAPALVGTYPIGASYGMATDASGETLFVANGFAGLASVDLRGAAPTVYTTFPTGANTVDVAVDNDAGIAYIVTFGGGMVSAYVADPTTITPLDSEPGFGFLQAIALDDYFFGEGQRAFVADGQAGLRLVDITNGADLLSVSTTPTVSPARDVASAGIGGFDPDRSNVYVAEDFAGLRRFEVSAYANAPVTATGSFASADRGIGVAVEEGAADAPRQVALMGGEVGVYLFDDLFVSAEGAPASAALVLDAVAPNPTAGAGTVRYRLAEAGAVTVAVYDLLGRRVALLADGAHAAGSHTARLDAGVLPAGLYVVRVTQAGASATARLAVVR